MSTYFLGFHIKFKSILQNTIISFFWQCTLLWNDKPQNQGNDYLWEEERAKCHQEKIHRAQTLSFLFYYFNKIR